MRDLLCSTATIELPSSEGRKQTSGKENTWQPESTAGVNVKQFVAVLDVSLSFSMDETRCVEKGKKEEKNLCPCSP